MPERNSFEAAIIRVVPRVEREEFINAGVVLLCPAQTRRTVKQRISPCEPTWLRT